MSVPPSPALRAVAYTSAAREGLEAADLDFIVAESRRLNAAAGITGVLLYCDGHFMQYFEGPEDAVRAAWARIRASGLHRLVVELMDQPVAAREFADWTLGFAGATASDFLQLAPGPWNDVAAIGPGGAMLQAFWRNCRSAGRP